MPPDELRKMADLADEDKLDVSWGNRMRVAADAWDETEGRLFDSHGLVMGLRKRLEAAEDKLRSEFRCRGLTDAEIASEFAALAGEKP